MENSNKLQSPKLKAFETIQKNLASVGITPALASQSYPFNATIFYGFLKLGSAVYCTSIFIIFDAETFVEYTQSIYVDSLAMLIIFALLIVILKVERLFKYISGNDLVNTSEFLLNSFYCVIIFRFILCTNIFFSIEILCIEINFHENRSSRSKIE